VRRFAIGLCAAQLLTAFGALCGAIIELESIVGTGPVLTVVGLLTAWVTRHYNSRYLLMFGLSAPAVSAFGAILIAGFHWSPPEARAPIITLLTLYALPLIPAALVAGYLILRGTVVTIPLASRTAWQYSLRTLLLTMTAVCIFTAVGQYFARMAIPDFPIVFSTFAMATIALSAAIVWRFVVNRRSVNAILASS
jgi:hypothetical protein